MACDLCAARERLGRAFLRRPWSTNYVTIVACTPCSARAWRTCGDMVALSEQVYAPPVLRLPPPIVEAP